MPSLVEAKLSRSIIMIAIGTTYPGVLSAQDVTQQLTHASTVASEKNASSLDPYSASFDDFEWSEPIDLQPIAGSKSVGEPVDYDRAVARYQQRVEAATSPDSEAAELTVLGKLLLRKAKADDDLPAYKESENALRRAVKLNPNYATAKLALANSLMASHGFKEAHQIVSALDSASPGRPATLASKFDCQVELGFYSQAGQTLDQLMNLEASAPVLARAARLAEIDGDLANAGQFLASALAALQNTGAPAEQRIWYHWRRGTIHFDDGKLGLASKQFQAALQLDGEDEAALVGLAKTYFAQGDTAAALKHARRAAKNDAPPVLALLGDILAYQGNDSAAEEIWNRTETLMREEAKVAKTAHSREVALFFADHGRNPQEAVELSLLDLAQREDAFALDCHAWALFKNSQTGAAEASIEKAMEAVPTDNQILFHAAVIANASGNVQQARAFATRIRNPKFSIAYHKQLHQILQ